MKSRAATQASMQSKPTDIIALKKQQRREVIARRDAVPEALRAEKSAELCRRILSSTEYAKANTIMLFKAFRSEADLSAFELQAERDGKILLYPYCLPEGSMAALRPADGGAWTIDSYGIRTPLPEKSTEYAPEKIDLVLCPCAGFDRGGHRLGMGAGYYDRFLPRCSNARFIIAAFAEQELPEIYTDEYDVRMHGIITDKEYIKG